MTPSRLFAFAVAGLTALSAAPVVAAAAPTPLEAAKQKAAALAAQINAQGDRLSLADERYNEAANRKVQLDASVTKARSDATAAEIRWAALRRRLDQRVKALYMHPGAPFAAWLNMRSLTEDARARVLSDSVLTSDANLVAQTDQARRDVRNKARQLDGLRTDAQQNVQTLASERRSVASALGTQRALLGKVQGDVAKLIAADRQRQLAQARRRAASSASPTAGTDGPSSGDTTTSDASLPPPPAPSPGAQTALTVARQQIGKPYQWAAAGPDSFDCSGLTMYAWGKAGVQLPHSAASQYDMLPKVARASLAPGDLVFFGSPIHHVGIYEGGGVMINAPQTGENVRRDPIDRADYTGAARP